VKLSLVLALAAALLAQAGEPRLSLVGGPQRAFGGTTVKRTFRVEGTGRYDLVWESRVFRAS